MSSQRGRWRLLAAFAGVSGLCSSCAFTGIDLVQDTRISLQAPRDGATVTVPLTVRWDVRQQIGRPGQRVQYAVFVDRAVIKPGADLRSVVPSSDTQCRADPACPDLDYLSRHDVFLVDQPSALITRLPKPSTKSKRETHRIIVVVLLDGHRQGEGAFSRTVYLKNQS